MSNYKAISRSALNEGDAIRVTFPDGSVLVGEAGVPTPWDGPALIINTPFGDQQIKTAVKFERMSRLPEEDGRYLDKDNDWWVREGGVWRYIDSYGTVMSPSGENSVALYAPFKKALR